ncbi:MAG: polyprenyl synthetase family protein [Lachnospiraceae bacterium]|nr:polyprenyl synthetase family protein [Lachnospiraceae bacterium]
MKKDRNLEAFRKFYEETYNRLDKKTHAYNRSLKKDDNPIIRPFMEDLADLNQGGKMLRGMLVVFGYQIARHARGASDIDLPISDALAQTFEMFQTGVLVHDDVIDNAAQRRGKITVHRRYEHRLDVRDIRMVSGIEKPQEIAKSVGICVGDLGIYYANKLLADSYGSDPALGQLISYFDDIVIQTIRGELLDVVLPYEIQDPGIGEEERAKLLEKSIYDIYFLKTAGYSVIGPLHLGMILGGAEPKEMAALDRCARDIGIAYQIMDDILGVFADPKILGKDVGSDVAEYKQTILYMYVRTMKPEFAEELLQYYGKKHVTSRDIEQVQRIFEESGALAYARSVLADHFESAERKISRMKFMDAEDKKILRGFISYCKGRRK